MNVLISSQSFHGVFFVGEMGEGFCFGSDDDLDGEFQVIWSMRSWFHRCVN